MKIKEKPARNLLGDSSPLVKHAINGIEERKGVEITCLDLKKIPNAPCDYFVICEGTSRTHIQSIASSVEEIIKKETGSRPWHVEGLQNGEWVLMDYIDVVVHIFQPEMRKHFALEEMWADADVKEIKLHVPAHVIPTAPIEERPKKVTITKVVAVKKVAKKKVATPSKVKSKAKPVAKVKVKTKAKVKTKVKIKVKAKVKAKAKPKAKAKTKTKVKSKVKTKSKKAKK